MSGLVDLPITLLTTGRDCLVVRLRGHVRRVPRAGVAAYSTDTLTLTAEAAEALDAAVAERLAAEQKKTEAAARRRASRSPDRRPDRRRAARLHAHFAEPRHDD
ncbi:MAG: hypothetical protein DI565_00540 [Ancylobacter novellus]|uniref:Uncharacterized protein n=1 Tax=Ancylobacter novellus TaxID=921 RepID=A0A2W5KU33_ANCNO|nr:MAG: hypothetical protein DI565_00540 [Ancylobacter novellus]